VSGISRKFQAMPHAIASDAAKPSVVTQVCGLRLRIGVARAGAASAGTSDAAACAIARMRASSDGEGSPCGPTFARRCASARSSGVNHCRREHS
jgi:hypothetical protein